MTVCLSTTRANRPSTDLKGVPLPELEPNRVGVPLWRRPWAFPSTCRPRREASRRSKRYIDDSASIESMGIRSQHHQTGEAADIRGYQRGGPWRASTPGVKPRPRSDRAGLRELPPPTGLRQCPHEQRDSGTTGGIPIRAGKTSNPPAHCHTRPRGRTMNWTAAPSRRCSKALPLAKDVAAQVVSCNNYRYP